MSDTARFALGRVPCCSLCAGISAGVAPERAWYEGRGAAESVKTLAWRYAVGGHPFVVTLAEKDADSLFLERCRDVMRDLSSLDVGTSSSSPQITDDMRALRDSSLMTRKEAYARGRILEQQNWYGGKASWNGRRATRWQIVLAVIEIIGVLGRSAGSLAGSRSICWGWQQPVRRQPPRGSRHVSTNS